MKIWNCFKCACGNALLCHQQIWHEGHNNLGVPFSDNIACGILPCIYMSVICHSNRTIKQWVKTQGLDKSPYMDPLHRMPINSFVPPASVALWVLETSPDSLMESRQDFSGHLHVLLAANCIRSPPKRAHTAWQRIKFTAAISAHTGNIPDNTGITT